MSRFWRPGVVFSAAVLLRVLLLVYGRWQDAHSPLKYTDIDYLVFTDAARYVSRGQSPYDRATYRYTPLLAWLLLPTTWGGLWFEFGKALFAIGDIATGFLILRILRAHQRMSEPRALQFASIWLLNPMVANISTRGSSEGLLAVIVVALLWAALSRRVVVAGILLGLGVHFKIYPFIYAASIFWWLGNGSESQIGRGASFTQQVRSLVSRDRIALAGWSFVSFMGLNICMYQIYGEAFLEHSYSYHLTRIDHRHNFSVYNTLLHLSSMQGDRSGFRVESVAFAPQLLLAAVAIPLLLAKKDLPSTMLAQTFAFVTFNKVCTSQYFLWYMVFLPFYLPTSSLMANGRKGVAALVLWIVGQALWLQQGYALEFLGLSVFVPRMWLASIAFFLVNCWILGIVVSDISATPTSTRGKSAVDRQRSR